MVEYANGRQMKHKVRSTVIGKKLYTERNRNIVPIRAVTPAFATTWAMSLSLSAKVTVTTFGTWG